MEILNALAIVLIIQVLPIILLLLCCRIAHQKAPIVLLRVLLLAFQDGAVQWFHLLALWEFTIKDKPTNKESIFISALLELFD